MNGELDKVVSDHALLIVAILALMLLVTVFSCRVFWAIKQQREFYETLLDDLRKNFWRFESYRKAIIVAMAEDKDSELFEFLFDPEGHKNTPLAKLKRFDKTIEELHYKEAETLSSLEQEQYDEYSELYERMRDDLDQALLYLICFKKRAALVSCYDGNNVTRVEFFGYNSASFIAMVEFLRKYREELTSKKCNSKYYDAYVGAQKREYERIKKGLSECQNEDGAVFYSNSLDKIIIIQYKFLPSWLQKKDKKTVI